MRRELLSYLETKDVYELANEDEMSAEMREKLRRGKLLLSGLNQYKYSPMTQEQIIQRFSKIIS